ncbi:hypothetical protein [Thermopetrobacter sp. TC1]|uniref:hypothetical protein n=1 Tax=Thermopetrobacter sp. TC1 TaxID=1495045 RepID=UPI00056DFFF5|nr:hypothetical protein [Thermopetrobacter sp. TC1]
MVKTIITGIVATIAALGSFYGVLFFATSGEAKVEPKKVFVALEQLKTDIISVPMIADGEVKGYVLARFVYVVESDKLKKLSIQPDPLLVDEAFRIIYATPVRDFQRIEKYDLAALTKRLKESVNKRLGMDLVREVLVDSINYVSKSEIRYRGLKQ